MTVTVETLEQQPAVFQSLPLERYQSRQPMLCRWVQQLQQAIKVSETNPDFWSAVGHGLIVADPDKDELQTFLMNAAGAIDGQYLNLNAEQFVGCAGALANETVPTVVFIEPGEWLTERDAASEVESLRLQVCAALKEFHEQASPVVVVSYAPRLGAIAERFRYRQAFDRHIFWAAPKPELIAQDLYDLVGKHYLDAALVSNPDRLGRVLSLEFPSARRVGMLAAALRRRAIFESRTIGWRDLIEISVNGTGEGFRGNDYVDVGNTATHEAGHAVVNMVGSGFTSVPDMVTVAHGNGTAGVVVESYHHCYEKRGGNLSFEDLCQRIRTCLAGRAAEELEYGLGGCGAFASQSDLENASRMAVEMVMQNGFPADYDNPMASGSNLFSVPDGSELGEVKYYDEQLRSFLEKLYQETKAILQANQTLFSAVRQALLKERYLMKEDLERILQAVDIKT